MTVTVLPWSLTAGRPQLETATRLPFGDAAASCGPAPVFTVFLTVPVFTSMSDAVGPGRRAARPGGTGYRLVTVTSPFSCPATMVLPSGAKVTQYVTSLILVVNAGFGSVRFHTLRLPA